MLSVPFEGGVLDLTAAPGSEAGPVETRHLRFVGAAWVALAAAAFEGWRRYGVGTVVVEPDVAERGRWLPLLPPRLLYATAEGPWPLLSRRTPAGAWADGVFQTYAPHTTALVAFVGAGEPARFYRVRGTPGPAAAFERVRALTN